MLFNINDYKTNAVKKAYQRRWDVLIDPSNKENERNNSLEITKRKLEKLYDFVEENSVSDIVIRVRKCLRISSSLVCRTQSLFSAWQVMSNLPQAYRKFCEKIGTSVNCLIFARNY